MPAYTRKTIPFLHRGMNWNATVDKIPEGQVAFAKNIRVVQEGSVTSAQGTSLFATLSGKSYIHSISRLNNSNPAIGIGFTHTYVIGADNSLYVGSSAAALGNVTINPITTPNHLGFSHNPLTIVDAQPVGASASWKYVGDSLLMVTTGYYEGDFPDVGMARCLTVGMLPPVWQPTLTPAGGGNLIGNYQWAVRYRRTFTGAKSNPSAASRNTVATPAIALSSQSCSFTLPNTPIDPQTLAPDTHIVVDVYRFGGTVLRWAYVGSRAGGSVFTDDVPDSQLLTAPAPDQVVDPNTGISRFNLYQPFVTQSSGLDSSQFAFTPVFNKNANNSWTLQHVGVSDVFPIGLLQGSTVIINGSSFTVYQVLDSHRIEVTEDASLIIDQGTGAPFVNGANVNWSIPSGSLVAGNPLPHLFGPYGIGQSAYYVFGVGDPLNPGTLYWMNGNDPDSMDLVNSLVVTSPSEPLRGGAIYDGRPYVWSTERMFAIYPSTTVLGQFTVEEIPGAKGLWMEYSLTVQSNGISDQSVTWRSKDGIYDWSINGLRKLTGDLYPFFPHDGQPGIAVENIFPFLGPAINVQNEVIGSLDDSQPKYHRLTWFQGILFYDFVAQSAAGQTFSTLVYDSNQVNGWVSVDQAFSDTLHPVARGIEIAANNLKVSHGNVLYDYTDGVRNFQCRFVPRSEDAGDPRVNKIWGDAWLDLTPAQTISARAWLNFNTTAEAVQSLTGTAVRQGMIFDLSNFPPPVLFPSLGAFSPTLGLDFTWTSVAGVNSTLYQWQPSFVAKPEIVIGRPTDKTDDGHVGAKYLMGMILEADTGGVTVSLDIVVDDQVITTVSVRHNTQQEKPYVWTPVIGDEFQLHETPSGLSSPGIAIFNVRWIWVQWEEFTQGRSYPFTNCGYQGNKFIQGGVIPIDTGGSAASLSLHFDGGTVAVIGPFTTPAGKKTPVAFSLSTPVIAHEIQIISDQGQACRVWDQEARWIWEPTPELVSEWKTPPMTHGMSGWLHQRLFWVAYAATQGATFKRYFDDGTSESYALGGTAGAYTKLLVPATPRKSRWFVYELLGGAGQIKAYVNDMEFHTKAWGSEGSYSVQKPIGSASVVQGAAI